MLVVATVLTSAKGSVHGVGHPVQFVPFTRDVKNHRCWIAGISTRSRRSMDAMNKQGELIR